MKRASYREAVEWIALNDGPGDSDALEPDAIRGNLTVHLIADLFEVPAQKVGEDIVKYRRKKLGWDG